MYVSSLEKRFGAECDLSEINIDEENTENRSLWNRSLWQTDDEEDERAEESDISGDNVAR